MAAGYTRQSAGNIQAGLPIQSADLNNEFNQLQSAFDTNTGHDHSGSASGTGAKINLTTSVTGVLPAANGGSGSLTAGSIPFSDGSKLIQDNAQLFWNDTTHTLGLGTATPVSGYQLNLFNPSGAASGIIIQGTGSGNTAARGLELSIGSGSTFVWNYENTPLELATNNTARIHIAADGKVGIGTASPAQQLDVNGNLNITGSYIYQVGGTGTINTTGGPFIYADTGNTAIKIGSGNGSLLIQNYAGTNAHFFNSNGNATITGALTLGTALAIASGGTGGTTQATAFANTSVAASSIASTGYLKLANGLIWQWGKATILGGTSTITVTYPLTFPTAIFSVTITPTQTSPTNDYGVSTVGPTAFNINSSGSVGSQDVYWLVVGN